MPILSCVNIKHRFGVDIILDGVSLSIEPTDRIGIVGRNGTGKSTLLKILTGLVKNDEGTVNVQRGCRVGYLHQDPNLDPDETLRGAAEGAFELLHATHRELDALFEQMATAQGPLLDQLMKKQVVLEEKMESLGGYSVDHQIDNVLHGVGFTDAQFNIKVKGLSGGQKGRLALARLLLETPDVLLLDEPTNHLDIEGRLWLEDFLANEYRGAVVMISHDRYLLDAVVTRIIEVEQGRLIDYPGNYEDFREIRFQRRLTQLRAYETQQGKFKKEEEYIRRFKAGQRAKQARGRQTRLTREKDQALLERPMEVESFKMELPKAPRTSDVVVSGRGLSKKFTNDRGELKICFEGLDITINRGDRWGIIGPNGAGKTTLVRALLGEIPVDAGIVRTGTNVVVGHYTQSHEHIDGELLVWQYLQKIIVKESGGYTFSEQQARNLAGAFLFSGSEQEKSLRVLSGGERSRAVLAGLLASAKSLLVLDEPTNHLDIPSAERLEAALAMPEDEDETPNYDGTMILISHDRALIDATCENLIILDGKGGAKIHHGTYTDWHEEELARAKQKSQAESQAKEKRESEERRQREAKQAKESAKKQNTGAVGELAKLRMDELEKRIEKCETRLREIDAQLANPDTWSNASKSAKLAEERAKFAAELEPLEFEWARRAEEP